MTIALWVPDMTPNGYVLGDTEPLPDTFLYAHGDQRPPSTQRYGTRRTSEPMGIVASLINVMVWFEVLGGANCWSPQMALFAWPKKSLIGHCVATMDIGGAAQMASRQVWSRAGLGPRSRAIAVGALAFSWHRRDMELLGNDIDAPLQKSLQEAIQQEIAHWDRCTKRN